MGRRISKVELSPTISLSECTDGWWLWDNTRGMNLSMKAASAQDAFLETISYYQRRLAEVEAQLKDVTTKVDAFVNQIHQCPPECEDH